MRNYIKTLAIIGLSLGLISNATAQDPHLSQYQVTPLLLNPAQTGYIDNSKMRIAANYRSQWASLGNNISTMSLAYDRRKGGTPWSYGGFIVNNNLADVFNNTALVGSVAYEITEPTNTKYHIQAGIQLGLIHKKFDISRLIFDNQYNDGNFDSDIPSMENLERKSRLLPETAIGGFYYNDNPEKELRPYGGFGLSHLTQPKENFLDGDPSKLPVRWNVQVGAKWIKDQNLTVAPYVLYMQQGSATEKVFGTTAEYTFEDTEFKGLFDLGYRAGDAVILQAGFFLRDNWYRISYDIHVSPLKDFTGGRNAVEFSATFTPKRGFFSNKSNPKNTNEY